MNREYWSRYCFLLGSRLLHGCPYPALGVAFAQAWLDPDASILACSATAVGILLFIAGLYALCISIGWLLANGEL